MKTGIKAADAMTVQPIFVRSDDSLEYCAKEMDHHHVGAILVKDEEDVLGLLTEQDIVRNCIAKGINPLDKKVAEYMKGEKVDITIDLNIGNKSFTAYTMDLTKKYIEINADYRS